MYPHTYNSIFLKCPSKTSHMGIVTQLIFRCNTINSLTDLGVSDSSQRTYCAALLFASQEFQGCLGHPCNTCEERNFAMI